MRKVTECCSKMHFHRCSQTHFVCTIDGALLKRRLPMETVGSTKKQKVMEGCSKTDLALILGAKMVLMASISGPWAPQDHPREHQRRPRGLSWGWTWPL